MEDGGGTARRWRAVWLASSIQPTPACSTNVYTVAAVMSATSTKISTTPPPNALASRVVDAELRVDQSERAGPFLGRFRALHIRVADQIDEDQVGGDAVQGA